MPKIVAHRGASAEKPENTMSAFRRAQELGVFGIELDVHVLEDKTCVVFHDSKMIHPDGTEKSIYFFNRKTIKEFPVSNKEFPLYDTETIPYLEEVLDFLKGNNLFLDLEIKYNANMSYRRPEDFIMPLLEEYRFQNRMIISSFDYEEILPAIKRKWPEYKLGAMYGKTPEKDMVLWSKENGIDAIHPRFSLLDKDIVEHAHRHNILVNAWTVNTLEDMRQMTEFGVDMMITDNPAMGQQLLKG